jgi:hypothetical protein
MATVDAGAYPMLIGGEAVLTEASIDVRNPATGEVGGEPRSGRGGSDRGLPRLEGDARRSA